MVDEDVGHARWNIRIHRNAVCATSSDQSGSKASVWSFRVLAMPTESTTRELGFGIKYVLTYVLKLSLTPPKFSYGLLE